MAGVASAAIEGVGVDEVAGCWGGSAVAGDRCTVVGIGVASIRLDAELAELSAASSWRDAAGTL